MVITVQLARCNIVTVVTGLVKDLPNLLANPLAVRGPRDGDEHIAQKKGRPVQLALRVSGTGPELRAEGAHRSATVVEMLVRGENSSTIAGTRNERVKMPRNSMSRIGAKAPPKA